MTTIDGTLKSDASVVGKKTVLFLAPWSDGVSAADNRPIRIHVELTERVDPTTLLKGTRVRVVCESVSPPVRDEPWWTATGTSVDVMETTVNPAEVTIDDPTLGTMKLNRRSNEFEGNRVHDRHRFRLSISRSSGVDDGASDPNDLARGRAFVAALERSLPRILSAVAKHLLPLYNDTWRGDLALLDEEEFIARMSVSSARTGDDEDGANLIYFADGDLFAGHHVEVFLDNDMQPTSIGLAG